MSEQKPQPKKKKKGVPLKVRMQMLLLSLLEVFYSTGSEEKDERKMARIAVAAAASGAFLILVGIVTTAILHTVYDDGSAAEKAERLRRKALEGKKETVQMFLGRFQVEIKRPPSSVYMGPVPMAEFDLAAECDGPEACSFLEANPDVVANEINAVLLPVEREEVTSRDGRDKIKKTVLQRLNGLVPKGEIVGVHFQTFFYDSI